MSDFMKKTDLSGRLVADGTLLVVVILWWYMALGYPPFVLPGPEEVLVSLIDLVLNPSLQVHVLDSLARVVGSVIAGALIAVPLAALTVRSRVLSVIVERNLLLIFNSFPSVGWAILGVIWYSASDFTVVFIETMIVIPFCLINVLAGFRQLDAEILEMSVSFTRNRWRRFAKVTMPLIFPFLIAGMRIAYGIAWKIALVAELFGATSGLGWLMQQAQSRSDGAQIFASAFIIVLLFAAGDGLVLRPLARRFSIN